VSTDGDAPTYPPHALGMLLAYVERFDDLRHRYQRVPKMIATEDDLHDSFREYGPGIFLFSDYLWTIKNNLNLSRLAKKLSPQSVTIHGGPSVPKYPETESAFLTRNDHVDFAVRGEGENTLVDLLRVISNHAEADSGVLASVPGIAFRARETPEKVTRTPDRARQSDLDQFPSPYLHKIYEAFEGLPEEWTAAIIETNRGCPYGCTFCDWGSATLQKIFRFSLERVAGEIEWIAKHKVGRLWIADANFGIFDRDIEIAQMICDARERFGYPREVIVNYAKNASSRLAQVIKLLNRGRLAAQGIISIQTHDAETLANIRRSNIRTEKYDELIQIFRREGLPISSDLLIGLPGATVETFKRDLQFFIDRQVHTVAYPLKLLPNSPMAEAAYREKFGIKVDREDNVVSTNSFSSSDLWKMKMLFNVYRCAIHFSVLKYILYFAQIDRGISATDFLFVVMEHLSQPKPPIPRLFKVFMQCIANRRDELLSMTETDWRELYQEVLEFAARNLGLELGTATDAVTAAQIAVMPRVGRAMPERIALCHDVVSYHDQFSTVADVGSVDRTRFRRLEEFGPVEVAVTDPLGICNGDYVPPLGMHQLPWELVWSRSMQGAFPAAVPA
jgi:radical SAM superfamily enzyme YgiQ (UPF0313 family)